MKQKLLLKAGTAVLLTAAVCMNPFVRKNLHINLFSDKQNQGWHYSESPDGSYIFYYDADDITEELFIPESLTFQKTIFQDSEETPCPGTYPMRFGGFRLRNTDGLIGRLFQEFSERIVYCFSPEGRTEYHPHGNSENKKILKKVTISDGVDLIGGCFDGCTSLSEVRLPADLTAIPAHCFESCQNLNDIEIPESVITIGERAFFNSGIQEITLPASTGNIKSAAFANCRQLSSVIVQNPNCHFDDSCGIVIYNRLNNDANNYNLPSIKKSDIHFSGTICGYSGSTAEAYANEYHTRFSSIGELPDGAESDLYWLDDILNGDGFEIPENIFDDNDMLKILQEMMKAVENGNIALPEDSDANAPS